MRHKASQLDHSDRTGPRENEKRGFFVSGYEMSPSKSERFAEFLASERLSPVVEANGDVRFTLQGENYVISAAEDDPNYFKLSYLHVWDASRTESAAPILNEFNARYKAVKFYVVEGVLCITTETLLPQIDEFPSIFPRCVTLLRTARLSLANALAVESLEPRGGPGPGNEAGLEPPVSASNE